jgi:hypothetical protein
MAAAATQAEVEQTMNTAFPGTVHAACCLAADEICTSSHLHVVRHLMLQAGALQ